VADTGNNRIVVWTDNNNGGVASVVDLNPLTLNTPRGIALVANGDLFISDTGNDRLIRASETGVNVVDLSAIGGLADPWHIIEGESSGVYIADRGNDRIVYWRNGNAQVLSITGLTPPLDGPTGVTGDDNTGYVIELNGRVLRFVGNSNTPTVVDPGLDPSATGFTDIAMERHTHSAFVTDNTFSRLLLFPNGLGPALLVDLFRNLNPVGLLHPHGLDVTNKGDVLIADTGHDRILVIPGTHEGGGSTIFAEPTPLFFGQTPVGTSIDMTLMIRNPSDRTVNVSGTGIENSDGSFSTEPGSFTIDPNGYKPLRVTFSPQTPGEKFATLVIWHDTGEPLRVPLNGFGTGNFSFAMLKFVAGYAEASPAGFTAPNFGAPGQTVNLRFSLFNPTGRSVGGLQFTFQHENPLDKDLLELLEIAPSDTLTTKGFTVYSNSALKVVDAYGDSVPAARIVVVPQLLNGLHGGILPPGNIHLGNVMFRIVGGQEGPPDLSLLGRTIRLKLVRDLVISDENGYAIPSQTNDRDAAVHVGIRGDVSLDGNIDIRDAVLEVRIILGYPVPGGGDYQYHQPISTAFIIADMKPDGKIDVLDIIAQINHILGLDPPLPNFRRLAETPTQTAKIGLGPPVERPDGKTVVLVLLDTGVPLAGAEFTLTFDPSSLTVGAPEVAAQGPMLDYRIAGGLLKIVLYTLKPEGGLTSGTVMWIPVKPRDGRAESELILAEARLGTRNAEPVEAFIVAHSQSVDRRPATPGV